jgi:hypothetical protein
MLRQRVESVEVVGMTVSDIDRSVGFFNKVLNFEKISDVEVHGAEYEKLQGVFGLRMRVVRMKLGAKTKWSNGVLGFPHHSISP